MSRVAHIIFIMQVFALTIALHPATIHSALRLYSCTFTMMNAESVYYCLHLHHRWCMIIHIMQLSDNGIAPCWHLQLCAAAMKYRWDRILLQPQRHDWTEINHTEINLQDLSAAIDNDWYAMLKHAICMPYDQCSMGGILLDLCQLHWWCCRTKHDYARLICTSRAPFTHVMLP